MGRRPDGALERDVLKVLWLSPDAMTPSDVRGRLDGDLAYTTVMTILSRLHDKGLAQRTTRGRAFAYAPTVTESELTAQRMVAELATADDRAEALVGFVGELDVHDVRALKALLDGGES